MLKEYVAIFNDLGGEAVIAPATPELIADGWPVCEFDTYTVEKRGCVIEDVRTEMRGMWGVPIAPNGVCVEVEFIRRGVYGDDTYVDITRPTEADLITLQHCGWIYDGYFAHKA